MQTTVWFDAHTTFLLDSRTLHTVSLLFLNVSNYLPIDTA